MADEKPWQLAPWGRLIDDGDDPDGTRRSRWEAIDHADGLCWKCGRRPGTMLYVGEGGALELTHGYGQSWCELCVVRGQAAYAREQAARLPELEERLHVLEASERREALA